VVRFEQMLDLAVKRFLALLILSTGCGDDASTSEASSTSSTGPETTDESFEPFDPEACAATPNAGPAHFSLDLDALPVDELLFESYEAECTVTSLSTMDGMLQTALDCRGDDDAVHATTFAVSAPPSGTPTWDAGDEVRLDTYIWDPYQTGGLVEIQGDAYAGAGAQARYAVLRRLDDDGFLAAGGQAALGVLRPTLESEVVGACGEVAGCSADPDQPKQAMISEPGGASVLLTGGLRAELDLLDGTIIIIDPELFHASSDCHSSSSYSLVAWRLQP
jgi:hypothetical protein